MSSALARAARHREAQTGFTLLELLISLSLLGVMLAMAFGVFVTAMGAVPRGEAMAERSARLRVATGLLAKQVRSMVNYPAQSEDEETYPFFWGEPSSFSFITAAPQHNGGEGLGWVTYWTDGRSLAMGERLIFSMSSIAGGGADASGQTVLLDGLTGVRFEYLRLEGDESEWRESWDGLEEQGLPAAIRVTIEGLDRGQTYWVEEIPVMPVVYGLGAYDAEATLQEQADLEGDDGGDEE